MSKIPGSIFLKCFSPGAEGARKLTLGHPKWSVGPVRSISQSPFLISTILDPFRLHFGCPKLSFWAPSAPGEKHFRKIDPGIFDMAWNYEQIKVAPRNSVQNPGLEIFRALLCVRKQPFPFTVIYVFFGPWAPLGTPPKEFLEFGRVPPGWAEIRSRS